MLLARLCRELSEANPHATPEQFELLLNKAKIWPYPWGAIFAFGNDMHIHIYKENRHKVFLRTALREVYRDIFSKYEYIVTSILKNKPEALDFDLRMGWKLIREDENMWYLEMNKRDFKYA